MALFGKKSNILLGVDISSTSVKLLELSQANDKDLQGLGLDVEEMEKVIDTLLEAERLNTRHAIINVSRVSARSLVDNLLADFFSRDKDRIETKVADTVFMNIDEVRVTLLIKNLVSNALHYSRKEDGPITIEVQEGADEWAIRVSDCGPGIPDDQAEFVGEPFYRGDPSRTRNTGGSGLGLYIARLVAEAHGGSLKLDQSVAKGASFVARFPFEPRR